MKAVGVVAGDRSAPGARRQVRLLADFLCDLGRDPAEFFLQETRQVLVGGFLEHADEHAQLHAVGMRLDGLRRIGDDGDLAREMRVTESGGDEFDHRVRVGDGGLFEIFVDAGPAALEAGFDGDRDFGAVRRFVAGVVEPGIESFVGDDFGAVFLGVHLELEAMGGLVAGGSAGDADGLAGRQQAVHTRGGDADALLAAAHAEAVEFAAVEEPAKDVGDLGLDDAGPVVADGDAEARGVGDGGAIGAGSAAGAAASAAGAVWGSMRSGSAVFPLDLAGSGFSSGLRLDPPLRASMVMWMSGRIPASSQASRELSTASLTVVSRALRGLSNPSRWRFLAKNSLTAISFCLVAMVSAVSRAGVLPREAGTTGAESGINSG